MLVNNNFKKHLKIFKPIETKSKNIKQKVK